MGKVYKKMIHLGYKKLAPVRFAVRNISLPILGCVRDLRFL